MSVLNWKILVNKKDGTLKNMYAVHGSDTYEIKSRYQEDFDGDQPYQVHDVFLNEKNISPGRYSSTDLDEAMREAHNHAFPLV